jgi:peroxiredoxin
MEFSGTGPDVKGWFFNGSDRVISNDGRLEKGELTLRFDSYAATLKATLSNGALDGEYITRTKGVAFHAVRAARRRPPTGKTPDVGGLWYLENVKSRKKGEQAWRLIVQQKGAELSAAILRVDGDTGAVDGTYQNGKFVLSHFSGSRPLLMTMTPQADGTLTVELAGSFTGVMTAHRPADAKAKGLPEPVDADQHTGVKDPSQPLAFSAPDLNGHTVSSTDARFRNKVVIINITGSWCPNCHDEAPFLAELYRRYHNRGLEIVALSFEEPEQLQNPTRLRAFVKEYGIGYTVLLAGETSSAAQKLTNARDWDAWPTTFFVGRDGLVKAVHAGFPSPGSGELYRKEKQAFVDKIENLLSPAAVTTK